MGSSQKRTSCRDGRSFAGAEDGAVPPQDGEVPAEDGLLRDPDFGLSEEERARIVRLEFSVLEAVRLTVLGQAARVEARLALDTVGQLATREGLPWTKPGSCRSST